MADNKIDILKTRLSVARSNEKDARKRWKEIIRLLEFKRDITVGGETSTQKIKYPLFWAAYDNYLSELTATPPQAVIEAEGREDLVKKIYWKGILENVKRRIHIGDLKERFVQSFVTTGKAVYKVGRKVETEKRVQKVKDKDGKTLVQAESEVVTKNETFVENIDPRKIYLSPETKYIGPVLGGECPYLIEEMVKTKEYVEETYGVKLEDDELEEIDPDIGDNEDKETSNRDRLPSENRDDLKRVRLYAYYGVWDTKDGQKPNCEVLFTYKRIVRQRELPYEWGQKKPYIVVYNFNEFFKPHARGCLDPVMDLDQEYNENMNRIRTYVRRMVNPKWAKMKGTTVDEDALLDPDVGVIVDESEPNAVRPLTPPPIDSSIFDKSTTVEQLFYLVTGLTYGASALNKNKTATGQNIQEQGANTKINRMVRKLERGQEELETMILQLEQQYAPQEGADIRITGADVVKMIRDRKFLSQVAMQQWQKQAMIAQQMGSPVPPQPVDEYEKFAISEDGRSIYTKYTPEDIQGQFELKIISQSSNRSNKAVRAQQIINALEMSVNDPSVPRADLWRELFALWNMDDLVDKVNDLPSNPMVAPVGNQPLDNSKATTEAQLQGGVKAQANQTVWN